MGNVKVNKFTASLEEQQSADYNEEEYSNLNDIETVLDSIGIKLRKNAKEYKDMEDVLQEIADIWDTLDQTTQNAVTTALAGTRQREMVLTLFNNWDSVNKYAEIAENSYGTAEKKMEAFTDSVEAAKNRVTVAVEEWAIALNGGDTIKNFYNVIAFLIRNLNTLGIGILGLTLILNRNNLATGAGKFANNILGQITSLGNFAKSTMGGNLVGALSNGEMGSPEMVINNPTGLGLNSWQVDYLNGVQEEYAKTLSGYTTTLNESQKQQMIALQNNLLADSAVKANTFATTLRQQTTLENMDTEQLHLVAEKMLILAKDKEEQTLWENIAKLEAEQVSSEDLARAQRAYAEKLQSGAVQQAAENADEFHGQGRYEVKDRAKQTQSLGIASMGFSIAGTMLGSSIGSQFGETGTIIGSLIGSTAGPVLGKIMIEKASAYLASGSAAGALAKLAGFVTNPIGAAVLAIGAVLFTGWLTNKIKNTKEKIEKAAQEFSDSLEKYNEYQSATTSALKYDELIKGVDSLGRNVSLTDDEYQSFVDTSNQLAETFPELIAYTDEQGNKFLGLNGKVTTITDSINEFVKAQQKIADKNLLNSDLWGSNYKEAFDEYFKIKQDKEKNDKKLNTLQNGFTYNEELGVGTKSNDSDNSLDMYKLREKAEEKFGKNNVTQANNILNIKASKEEIDAFFKEIASEINNESITLTSNLKSARQKIANEVDAIMRLFQEDEEYSTIFDGMDEQVTAFVQQAVTNGVNFKEGESKEDFEQRIKDTILEIGNAFKENPELLTLYYQIDEAKTQGEAAEARSQFASLLKQVFGTNWEDDGPIGKLIINWGFKKDGDNIVDDSVTFNKLKDIAKDNGIVIDKSVTESWFNGLTTEEANKVFEYYREGIANVHTSIYELQNLLANDLVGTSVDKLISQFDRLANIMPNYTDRVTNFFKQVLKEGNVTTSDIANTFSDLPESIRNSLLNSSNDLIDAFNELTPQVQQAVLDGMSHIDEEGFSFSEYIEKYITTDDINGEVLSDTAKESAKQFAETFGEELQNSIDNLDLQTSNLKKQILGEENSKMWSDAGIDGIIDTFSELKSTLDSLAESYDKLKSAQDEQTQTGKISLETALDLLSTNSMYALAMDVTANGIKLKSNAEEIMAEAQYKLIEANLQAAISEKEQAIQTAQNELVALLAGESYVTSSNDKIGATEQEVSALDASTTAYETNTAAMKANAQMKIATLSGDVDSISSAIATADASSKQVGKTKTHTTSFEATKTTTTMTAEQRQSRINQLVKMVGSFDEDEGTFSGGYLNKELEVYKGSLSKVQDIIANKAWGYKTFSKFYNAPDKTSSSGKDKKATDYLDTLEKIHDLIDKDWEAMQAFTENRQTEYFDKMRESLTNQINEIDRITANAQKYISSGMLTENELIELQKKRIDLAKEMANLDDEEWEDRISILDTLDATLESQILAQEELLKTSDTEEERLERQQKLNDLIKQEYELRMNINEWEEKNAERAQKYLSGNAYSNAGQYDVFTNLRRQNIKVNQQEAWNNYTQIIKQAEANLALENKNGGKNWTPQEIYNKARETQEARDALDKYFEYVEQENDLINEAFEAKVDELDTRISELEKTKPEEWGHLADIQPYYNNTISLIQAKISQIEEALSNTQGMTDEQIQAWVDKYNEAIQALHDAQKSALEDITNYQSNQFNALTDWIEEYKQNIEDLRSDVGDYYDDLIDKLNDYNEDLDRTNTLLEKQKNLQDQLNNKQRVYREGSSNALYKDSYIS